MKKSSVVLTVLLVIALVFAVSCPGKTPTVSITGEDITTEATVGTELADFTFNIEIVNGEFLDSAKDKTLTIKGLDAFNASETNKASATATITALTKDKDSKNTKAIVTVSKFTAKKATTDAQALTFEIPAVTSGEPTIIKGEKGAIAIGGKAVKIKANAVTPTKQDVTMAANPTSKEFNVGAITADNTVTFTLTGAKWTSTTPTITAADNLSFTFNKTSDAVLTLTITGTTSAAAAAKDYTFTVNSSNVTVDEGYQLPAAGLTGKINITIKSKN